MLATITSYTLLTIVLSFFWFMVMDFHAAMFKAMQSVCVNRARKQAYYLGLCNLSLKDMRLLAEANSVQYEDSWNRNKLFEVLNEHQPRYTR